MVIGRTSARPGERDYVIDPEVTEREYLENSESYEREIHRHTERGLDALRMVRREFFWNISYIYFWGCFVVFVFLFWFHPSSPPPPRPTIDPAPHPFSLPDLSLYLA